MSPTHHSTTPTVFTKSPVVFRSFLYTVVFAVSLVIPQGCNCEVYTSVQDLTEVFAMEGRVVDALGVYVKKTEERLTRIRRYLQDYEQVIAEGGIPPKLKVVGEGSEGGEWEELLMERLAGNPLHAFHLLKRLTVHWKNIEGEPPQDDWRGVEEAFILDNALPHLPREEDLHGAAQALVRLQSIYHLNTSSLVRGNVLGIQSAAELQAQDCLYMGKHSFNMGMYYNSIEWFEEAYTMAGLERNTTVTQGQVMEFLNIAIKAYEESLNNPPSSSNAFTTPQSPPLPQGPPTPLRGLREPLKAHSTGEGAGEYPLGENISDEQNFINFEALCRGEKLLSPTYTTTLSCHYDTRGDSYYTLMPVKVEVAHEEPQILFFHDILSEYEISTIKELAKPQLARGMVQGQKGKGNTVSSTRTSKVAWLDDIQHPVLVRVNKKVSLLTGLSTEGATDDAELLQVANYGIGGHYNPHHDYLMADKSEYEVKHNIHPREKELGDRMATFMFYLSNVSRGGATAFPKLGVTLWPRKGSAAFWYNLRKNGKGDIMTLHGACPVVHGSKWVSNKWIRERGQIFRRKCTLFSEE